MSKIEVNQISSQCGSTLTIGQSGDTIQLACGATQTGFGRTGTVDWDTTAKTASFTAVSGNGYFVNTTSGTITVTLPASPSAGDIVGIKDYAGTFATNNVTVGRNGSLIDATGVDATLTTPQLSVFFVYVDGTQGWNATQSDAGDYGARFITATGGTVTCCGDYKIHTFTGPGTFTVTSLGNPSGSDTVDYLVVAGGAGGSMGEDAGNAGSGAGGLRFSASTYTAPCTSAPRAASALPVSAQSYPIVVGGGGAGIATCGPVPEKFGNDGSDSSFSTITSTGGGGGGKYQGAGRSGGSGGGTGSDKPAPTIGGAGNTPLVSPSQGFPGGAGIDPAGPNYPGAGGGGAGAAGADAGPAGTDAGANGGVGLQVNIDGNTYYWSGGGGGVSWTGPAGAGNGGLGGGGGGSASTGTVGTGGGSALNSGSPGGVSGTSNCGAGGANTGGGAGGALNNLTGSSGGGGSGIVIIRYRYQ